MGYNHTPAPAGAVYNAAKASDFPALLAALEAGGSTEEEGLLRDSEVSGHEMWFSVSLRFSLVDSPVLRTEPQDSLTPLHWAAARGPVDALRTLLAAGANPQAAAADKVRGGDEKNTNSMRLLFLLRLRTPRLLTHHLNPSLA